MLVVGHSHVLCIQRHLARVQRPDVEVLQLRTVLDSRGAFSSRDKLRAELEPMVTRGRLAAICVCVAGNLHNRIGTVEHPHPFGLHDPVGSVTAVQDRWPVPWAVMRHTMQHFWDGWLQMADTIYAQFPGSARFYLNPPPPIPDWSHIHRFPGQFKPMLHLGPAPAELRLQLYRLQSSILLDYARRQDATLVSAPTEATDASGFLAPDCWDQDPTHANRRYGMLAFRSLMRHVGGLS